MNKKTDNGNLKSKLELRKHFIDKFLYKKEFSVFDACQGNGLIWESLKKKYKYKYWEVDVKKKKGRLKIESQRILQQPGWLFDVIDIDTYGQPWKHWLSLLPNITAPVIIFLTIGMVKIGGGGTYPKEILNKIFPKFKMDIPKSLISYRDKYITNQMLAIVENYKYKIIYAAESESGKTVRYIGMYIKPSESTHGP